jgi:hypothetical protein
MPCTDHGIDNMIKSVCRVQTMDRLYHIIYTMVCTRHTDFIILSIPWSVHGIQTLSYYLYHGLYTAYRPDHGIDNMIKFMPCTDHGIDNMIKSVCRVQTMVYII